MFRLIVLDSAPLSLLTQRKGVALADDCRQWLAAQTSAGTRIMIAEIIDYELRRELIRARKVTSLTRLDVLNAHADILYAPLNTTAIRKASSLWAEVRQRGLPTADARSLDIDTILAA